MAVYKGQARAQTSKQIWSAIYEFPAQDLMALGNLLLHVKVQRLNLFWTPGLPEGVLSNRLCGPCVRPSVCPSLNISKTAH